MSLRVSPAWLWLLVLLQLAIPASYYLLRADREDERFAWRMFSAVRLKRCDVEAFEGTSSELDEPREIDLQTALHASWQRSIERGRQPVIARFLANRCTTSAHGYAVIERRCVAPSGRRLASESYRYDCARALLEVTQ